MTWLLLTLLVGVSVLCVLFRKQHTNDKNLWAAERKALNSRLRELSRIVRLYGDRTVSVELEEIYGDKSTEATTPSFQD